MGQQPVSRSAGWLLFSNQAVFISSFWSWTFETESHVLLQVTLGTACLKKILLFIYFSISCRSHHIKPLQFLVLTSWGEMAVISAFCCKACREQPGSALSWAFPLPYTLITMTFRAARSFSFQYTLIMEWQVKKPHAVVGSQTPASLSHGKHFQMGPPLSRHNKASALWHGKNALSPSGTERAIEGRPGLLSAAQAVTVTQAGGWWASDLHTALAG